MAPDPGLEDQHPAPRIARVLIHDQHKGIAIDLDMIGAGEIVAGIHAAIIMKGDDVVLQFICRLQDRYSRTVFPPALPRPG